MARLAAKGGFSVYLKADEPMTVKLKQLPRMGMLKPARVEYKTIAEVQVKLESGRWIVTVHPMVYGNLRPKVDDLMTSLNTTEIKNIQIVKTR